MFASSLLQSYLEEGAQSHRAPRNEQWLFQKRSGRLGCLLGLSNFVIHAGKSRYIIQTLGFTSHLLKTPNTNGVCIWCSEVLLNLHWMLFWIHWKWSSSNKSGRVSWLGMGGLHAPGSEKPSGLPLTTCKFICALVRRKTFTSVPAMPGFSD